MDGSSSRRARLERRPRWPIAGAVGLAAALALALTLSLAGPDPAAGARDRFGAIAYDATSGGVGTSFARASRRGAENQALRDCRQSGNDHCRAVVWVRNGCAAIASDPARPARAGWATGPSRRVARQRALEACDSARCRGRAFTCTSR